MDLFNRKGWEILHIEETTVFLMNTLIVQAEEEFQQLTEMEKEVAVVLTISQKIR